MFLKLGQTYYARLNVNDHNQRPVNDDVPMMTVQDKQTKEYYNGIHWQKTPIALAMMCVGDGTYTGQFTPDKVGEFTVAAESGIYGCSMTESVEVYDGSQAEHSWPVGVRYNVEYTLPSIEGDAMSCTIANEESGEYWNGQSWQQGEFAHPMTHVGSGKYLYTFVPANACNLVICIACSGAQYQYTLRVTDDAEEIPPVIITNRTLLSLDGTDSTVLADNEFPIAGADVKVYDPATKEVVARTQTNSSGEWQLMLKPGVWQFLFEKDGYISVAFERSVS